MKKEVITPIQDGTFLHTQTASITLISARRIRILFLHLHRQVEELTPHLPRTPHQLMANAMVDHLKEPEFPARLRNPPESLLPEAPVVAGKVLEINDRDIDIIIWSRILVVVSLSGDGPQGFWLDIAFWDCS